MSSCGWEIVEYEWKLQLHFTHHRYQKRSHKRSRRGQHILTNGRNDTCRKDESSEFVSTTNTYDINNFYMGTEIPNFQCTPQFFNYSLQSSRPKRVLNVFYRNVNCSFVVLLQIYHQQQQTASSVWDVLLVYCQHFLQSGFTSAKLYTTGLEIQNKKHAELYRQADILSLSLSDTHSSCSIFVPLILVHTLSFKHTHLPFFLWVFEAADEILW